MPIPANVFHRLMSLLFDRACRNGASSLNDTEAALAIVTGVQDAMNSGGFYAFFINTSGWFARDTPRALQAIGASNSASLVKAAIPIYLGDLDRSQFDDKRKWHKSIEDRDGDNTAEADELNAAFFRADEPLLDLLDQYMERAVREIRIGDGEAVWATPLERNWRQCASCSDAWELAASEPFGFCPTCENFTALRGVIQRAQ